MWPPNSGAHIDAHVAEVELATADAASTTQDPGLEAVTPPSLQ